MYLQAVKLSVVDINLKNSNLCLKVQIRVHLSIFTKTFVCQISKFV